MALKNSCMLNQHILYLILLNDPMVAPRYAMWHHLASHWPMLRLYDKLSCNRVIYLLTNFYLKLGTLLRLYDKWNYNTLRKFQKNERLGSLRIILTPSLVLINKFLFLFKYHFWKVILFYLSEIISRLCISTFQQTQLQISAT